MLKNYQVLNWFFFVCVITIIQILGCTVIQIKNADKISTTIYPGLLNIHVNDTNNNFAISSIGLGAYISNKEIVIGYHNDQKVYMNDISKSVTVFFDNHSYLLNSPTLGEKNE